MRSSTRESTQWNCEDQWAAFSHLFGVQRHLWHLCSRDRNPFYAQRFRQVCCLGTTSFQDHFLFWIWQVWLWKARVGKFGKPHPVHAERCEWSKALVDWSESWLHMVNCWVMSPCVTSNTREPLKIPLQTSSCRGLCYLSVSIAIKQLVFFMAQVTAYARRKWP